ncbi:hypothetical protein RI367_006333 [Sorochytrium milnesiophthora]
MTRSATSAGKAGSLGRDMQRSVDTLLHQDGKVHHALRQISLEIHDNPELCFKEVIAYRLLTQFLEEHGFRVEHHACGIDTAFVATFEVEQSQETSEALTVAFCSEYDALPEIGHACATKETMIEHGIAGKVVLLGTPAEEGGGGKSLMIKRGALEDVDFCLMVHPGAADNSMPPCLAMQWLDFSFEGKAAHAAAQPWEGVNALDAMCLAFSHIGLLRQQMRPTNRIHGVITDGGKAPNVIPDRTEAKFIVRSQKLKDLRELVPRVTDCFNAAATATGCQVNVSYKMGYENLLSNRVLKTLYQGFMAEYGVQWPSDEEMASKSLGSTDFGDVTHVVPGLHPMFYVGVPGVDIHTKEFTAAASTAEGHLHAMRAAKSLALTALTVLRHPHRYMDKMRTEFERQKQEDESA